MGVSVRTPEIDDEIVAGVADGTPLAEMCRKVGIGVTTVYNWRDLDADFAERIARAREAGHDVIAARTREVARGEGESSGDVQRDKLIIETDLKLLAKWDPKRYGDLVKHSGPDGTGPALAVITPDMTPQQAAEAYSKMVG